MLICDIVRDIDLDHTGDVIEPVFQPLEYFSTDLIVLPKSYNPASGVERLYVVGVDAPLFPKRGLPTHCPRKRRWIAQMIVSGGDKKLRNLPFIQVTANGKVARRSERAEHQQDIYFLDETARKLHGGRRIAFVIIRDKSSLTAANPAALVDHRK